MQITLTNNDQHTVLQYFTARQREAGYLGPCFINVHKLSEIHMKTAIIKTKAALNKIHRKI